MFFGSFWKKGPCPQTILRECSPNKFGDQPRLDLKFELSAKRKCCGGNNGKPQTEKKNRQKQSRTARKHASLLAHTGPSFSGSTPTIGRYTSRYRQVFLRPGVQRPVLATTRLGLHTRTRKACTGLQQQQQLHNIKSCGQGRPLLYALFSFWRS